MNNARRKEIEVIKARLEAVFEGELEAIRSDLNEVKDAEQEAWDNMPESLQEGERGQAMQEAIAELESAVECVESFDFESVFNSLDNASN